MTNPTIENAIETSKRNGDVYHLTNVELHRERLGKDFVLRVLREECDSEKPHGSAFTDFFGTDIDGNPWSVRVANQ